MSVSERIRKLIALGLLIYLASSLWPLAVDEWHSYQETKQLERYWRCRTYPTKCKEQPLAAQDKPTPQK
jgi:hypothetical protein